MMSPQIAKTMFWVWFDYVLSIFNDFASVCVLRGIYIHKTRSMLLFENLTVCFAAPGDLINVEIVKVIRFWLI